jgi:protein-arginine kinase activator protein McsA
MRCTNCHKKIAQTELTRVWYHVKTSSNLCYEPLTATPKGKR